MFCKKCGMELKDGALFCSGCGEKIIMPASDSQAAEPVHTSKRSEETKPAQITEKTRVSKSLILLVVLVAAIIVVVGLLLAVLLGRSNKKEGEVQGYEETMADLKDEPEEIIPPIEEPASAETSVQEEPIAEPEPEEPVSQYFLPESDSRYLTMEELEGFTEADCRIARNELYARHGRRFHDENLQAYFDSCEWYQGTIAPEDFDESVLNEYELANRDLIVQYESVLEARNVVGTTVYHAFDFGITEFNMSDGILTFSSDGGARYGEKMGDSFYCSFPVAEDCAWAYYGAGEKYPYQESNYEDMKNLIDSGIESYTKQFQKDGELFWESPTEYYMTVTDGKIVDVRTVSP